MRGLTIGGYPCGTAVENLQFCTGVHANVLWSLAWAAVLFLVFLPLAARGWRTLE